MTMISGSDDKSGTPEAGAAGGSGQAQQAAGGSADWVASLPEELKNVVTTKGYKTPADVVQAYANASKLIGVDKIPVPKDGVWDPEARQKLGIPADAKGYKYEKPVLPEGLPWDEKFEATALDAAAKMGLTNQQVQGLIGLFAAQRTAEFNGLASGREAEREQVAETLKSEWGNAFNAKIENASRAARYLGGDELIAALEESGAGNNPQIIKAFAKIGGMLKEDQMRQGTPSGFNLTPEEARTEANKLMASDAYTKTGHPEHAAVVQKVQALFRQAYPES